MSANFKTELIYENELKLSEENSSVKKINLIHFNDVYNIEPRNEEPVGGAARFMTIVEHLRQKGPNALVFSGDAISPSSLSLLMKGRQMIEILNECQIAAACVGNHEFDLGMEVLEERLKESNFPWLLSNAFDADTNEPLPNLKDRHMVEINGIKIGFMGLAEPDWIKNLSTVDPDDILYESYVHFGRRIAKELREEGCDLVIAITHMIWKHDIILSKKVPEIDLILGGHDHDYVVKAINDKWVVKSGMDFREISFIEIAIDGEDKKVSVEKIEKYVVESEVEENSSIKTIVDSNLEKMNLVYDVLLGQINVDLEGRFAMTQTQETNLGNFICDIMLGACNAQFAFFNSGVLRSGVVHPSGDFKIKDLKKILPFSSEICMISISGSKIVEVLENSVSMYPIMDGRFLQVGGIKFAFDPSKPNGSRIDPALIQIQDEYLDLDKTYTAVTNVYLHDGRDNYDCLKETPILIQAENFPSIYTLIENHFQAVEKLKNEPASTEHHFRTSVVPRIITKNLIDSLSKKPMVFKPEQGAKLNFRSAALLVTNMLILQKKILTRKTRKIIRHSDEFKKIMSEYESKANLLAPAVDGRIIKIENEDHLESLLKEKEQKLAEKNDKTDI